MEYNQGWNLGTKYILRLQNTIFITYYNYDIFGGTELESGLSTMDNNSPAELQIEKVQMHPRTAEIILEPLELLDTLSRGGMSDWYKGWSPNINTFRARFWNNQNELIVQDIYNCNKTAWIIPNYMAQDISRNLTKSGYHSDVGTVVYSKPFLYLRLYGMFPISLLKQFSRISATGVVEWWPNFINRTDLQKSNEKSPPTKPNMRGHTQVIFILLGIGLLIAFTSFIGELGVILYKGIRKVFKFFRSLCKTTSCCFKLRPKRYNK